MRLLLIEDDKLLGQGIMLALQDKRYLVDWVEDGKTGLSAIIDTAPDLVILDLNLPGMDGIEVLNRARQANVSCPVIILTARDAIEDRIRGLDAGADDYLVKPFSLHELEARIRALHRRAHGRANEEIIKGELSIDTASRQVSYQGLPVNLGRREYDLLITLLDARGRVLTRRQLESQLYEDDPESNALEVHVHALRKKIDKSLIRTVRGVGYMVDA
ncbi:MAG: response regulator [Pontibacterium sp.]